MMRAGGAVDLLARRADGGGRHGGGLGLVQHGVGLGDLGGDFAGEHAAGDVGAVAVHRPAEVAQHDLVLSDDPIAGVVVRAGGVLAGGDDREVDLLVALGDDPRRQVGRYLGLGASDQRDPAGLQLGRDAVDGGTGGTRAHRSRPGP